MSTATTDALMDTIVSSLTGTTTAGTRIDVERIAPYTDEELAEGPRLVVFATGEQATYAGGGRDRYACRGGFMVQAVVIADDEAALRKARVALLEGVEPALFGPDAALLPLVDRIESVTIKTDWGTRGDGATLVSESRVEFAPTYTDTYPATVAGVVLAGMDLEYDLTDEGEPVDITQTVEGT